MNLDNKKTNTSGYAAAEAGKKTAKGSASDDSLKNEAKGSGTAHTDDRSSQEVHQHENQQADQKEGQQTGSVEDLQQEITRLSGELEKTRDSMLRKAAEFENLKRRTQMEKLQLFDKARADAVSRFLPIREDLKRTIEASKGHDLDDSFLEGLKLVLANFERVLNDYGVEPIEETGVPFDVDKHDAMLIQPASDESTESNTVIQVMEPGYKIGDRIIKHAKVIVSQ